MEVVRVYLSVGIDLYSDRKRGGRRLDCHGVSPGYVGTLFLS